MAGLGKVISKIGSGAAKAGRGAKKAGRAALLGAAFVGLVGDDFAGAPKKGKLGVYAKTTSKKVKNSTHKSVPKPGLEAAKKESKQKTASLSTITKQLERLIIATKKVGVMTKEHERLLKEQMTQAERALKESELESNAQMEPSEGLGQNITPLNDAMMQLVAQLNQLNAVLQEKVSGSSIGNSALGAASMLGGRGKAPKAPKLNKGFHRVETAAGTRFRNTATGRYASSEQALKGSLMNRASKSVSSGAARVTGAGSRALALTRVGGVLAKGLKSAGGAASKVVSSAAIKKLALPIVSKGLGKTALKSIPILGAVAGVGFAANRLVNGDVVGAGLDLVSGLGGPLTAIPAFIAATARDVYTSAYGIPPEEDPNAGSRLTAITAAIKALVEETLRPAIKPKQNPTQPKPTFSPPPQNNKQPANTAPKRVAPPPKPSPAPKGGGGGAPGRPAASTSGSTSAPPGGGGSTASSTVARPEPNKSDASKMPASPAVGAAIISSTTQNAQMASSPPVTVSNASDPIAPAKTPTSRSGAVGIGNVPDPNYGDHGTVPAQLYFQSAV